MPAAPALAPRPDVEPPARWRFPVPDRLRLGNGVSVYSHHLPGQHVATIICHLGIPLTAEPDGCDGIAAVMAACLGADARSLPAREFERQAAACGITWQAAAGPAGPVITVQVPAARLAEALDLLRLALAEPAFDPAGVTRQVQITTRELREFAHLRADATRLIRDQPDPAAGARHPLPTPIEETP
jgi:zinc protease